MPKPKNMKTTVPIQKSIKLFIIKIRFVNGFLCFKLILPRGIQQD